MLDFFRFELVGMTSVSAAEGSRSKAKLSEECGMVVETFDVLLRVDSPVSLLCKTM